MRTLFTGTELVNDRALLINGDRIEGFAGPGSEPADADRIDCGGSLVIAGLCDLQIAGEEVICSPPTRILKHWPS
ncbi:MAG: hypothetical protein R2758_09600 [Bacteroidales bacterium]